MTENLLEKYPYKDKEEVSKIEDKIDDIPESTDETVIEEQPKQRELSIEDKARLQGWVPKNEFRGDPDAWVDAREHLRFGSLLKRTKQLEKALSETALMAGKAREEGHRQALRDLENEKRAARATGDYDALEKVIAREHEAKQEYAKIQPQQQPINPLSNVDVQEKLNNFSISDPWVKGSTLQDKKMLATAKVLAEEFYKDNPGATVDDELRYIGPAMREEYPDYFHIKKERASKVSSPAGMQVTSKYPSTAPNNPHRNLLDNNKEDVDDVCRKLKLPPGVAMMVRHMDKQRQDYKDYLKEAKKQGLY